MEEIELYWDGEWYVTEYGVNDERAYITMSNDLTRHTRSAPLLGRSAATVLNELIKRITKTEVQ